MKSYRESNKFVQHFKQNPIESLIILHKALEHLRQGANKLVKKYTGDFLSRLREREGVRKILWYQIWSRSCRIIDKTQCDRKSS